MPFYTTALFLYSSWFLHFAFYQGMLQKNSVQVRWSEQHQCQNDSCKISDIIHSKTMWKFIPAPHINFLGTENHTLYKKSLKERLAVAWHILEGLHHYSRWREKFSCPGSLPSLLKSPNYPIVNSVIWFRSNNISLRRTGVNCMGPRYSEIELVIIMMTLMACGIKDRPRETRNTGRTYVTYLPLKVLFPLCVWVNENLHTWFGKSFQHFTWQNKAARFFS